LARRELAFALHVNVAMSSATVEVRQEANRVDGAGRIEAPAPLKPNQVVADRLREAADLLEQQRAEPHRVRAYRDAARTVAGISVNVRDVADRGTLHLLPAVGPRIARAIEEILRTGHWSFLERLRGTLDPEKLFRAVPGIGPALSGRIHDALHVESLEALEAAAHDGRLARVAGVGPRRAAMIRASLASMLGRPWPPATPAVDEPPVDELLDVDREYRERGGREELPRIAPRRFNPERTAWLPILHTERADRHYTALFSNTARANELGRTADWVVIHFHRDHGPDAQWTVVTETRGARAGARVVRGREAECEEHYRATAAGNTASRPT
jgi:DNA polymerase (family 10)